MSIQYTYEIIAVDQAARAMEVVYTSEGRQTMHIGARLPYLGESLESVVQMYAPVAYWLEQEATVLVPQIGVTGVVSPIQATQPAPDPKMIGVNFSGVMCSATAQDMWGLNCVFTNYQLEGQAFQPTRFDFDNGNSLVLTKDNIIAFRDVWVPFRKSFFTPDQ